MLKKLSFIFFLIVPMIFIIVGFSFDRTKYGTDPESAYLINGLNIATGKAVGHYDNPGTTVQLYSAVILRITHLTRMSGTDIQTDVLSHSELYIETLRKSLIVLNALIILLLGIYASLLLGNIWPGLILQLAPFLSFTLVEQFYTKVAPEPILFAATSLLVLLLLRYYLTQNRENSKYAILFGTLAGFGLATKMTFLPVLIIPFIVLETKKLRYYYILCILPAFILFTLPAAKGYLNMLLWFLNLGTHTGTYGQGETGIINPHEYVKSLLAIVKTNKAMISLMVVGSITWLISVLQARKTSNDGFKKEHRLILAVILCQVGSIIMIAKHYHSNHYFFPALSLMGLLIVTLYLLLRKRLNNQTTWYSKLSLPLAAAAIVGISLLNIPQLSLAYKGYRMSNHSTDETLARLSKEYTDYTKIYYYPSSFNVYASLRWGNIYARRFHTERLMQLYPEGLFYNAWEKTFQLWETDITPRELMLKYGGKLLLVGGPRTYPEIKLVEENGIKLKKLFEGRVQVVYEIDTANSPLFKNIKKQSKAVLLMNNSFEYLSHDKQWIVNDKQERFCKSNYLQSKISRTGKQALELPTIDTYAMEYHQSNIKPGDEYEISIWQKGPNQDVYLCASGDQTPSFYEQSKGYLETDTKGWQKIVLSFTIPKDFKGNSLKIYLWNHSNNKVWFDDFQINKY